MDLWLYVAILRRRAPVIVIVSLVAVTIAAAVSTVLPRMYTASTTIRVLLDTGIPELLLREEYNRRLLNTYVETLSSEPILETVIERLVPRTGSLSVELLRRHVEVATVPDTELIAIHVQDRDPALARDIANELPLLLAEYVAGLYRADRASATQLLQEQLSQLEAGIMGNRRWLATSLAEGAADAEIGAVLAQIELQQAAYRRLLERYELAQLSQALQASSITVMTPATLPQHAETAGGNREVALSLVVGLLSGIGLALLQENLDTRIHSSNQLEQLLGLPILGTVPAGWFSFGDGGASARARSAGFAEDAYRLFSINLLAASPIDPDDDGNTILITSAVAGEGKTTVSGNLAQALASWGKTVILVDGNLGYPSLTRLFGADSDAGLSDFLTGDPEDRQAIDGLVRQTQVPCLYFLGAGLAVADPSSLLASQGMERVIRYLASQGQFTVLDGPPTLEGADASIITTLVDGVVLVVRQSFSTRDQVFKAVRQLEQVHASVMGVVFVERGHRYRRR